MRPSGRQPHELRTISIETGVSRYAEGSCMIAFGNTRVLCTATVETSVPPFLRNTGKGWVTAEYSMLPRATETRNARESVKGKLGGRTHEIQRLIGRALRSVVNLPLLGERQVIVDCDVIEADGGTRTASITGGYVALHQAMSRLIKQQVISVTPIIGQVAALSCGVFRGVPVADLDYAEDSKADMDANFVLTADGKIVEIQCTAEDEPVEEAQFHALLELARGGVAQLAEAQRKALNIA